MIPTMSFTALPHLSSNQGLHIIYVFYASVVPFNIEVFPHTPPFFFFFNDTDFGRAQANCLTECTEFWICLIVFL